MLCVSVYCLLDGWLNRASHWCLASSPLVAAAIILPTAPANYVITSSQALKLREFWNSAERIGESKRSIVRRSVDRSRMKIQTLPAQGHNSWLMVVISISLPPFPTDIHRRSLCVSCPSATNALSMYKNIYLKSRPVRSLPVDWYNAYIYVGLLPCPLPSCAVHRFFTAVQWLRRH